MIPLSTLNTVAEPEFTALLGGIYEHSPWVARRTFPQTPFQSLESLTATMRSVVETASPDEHLALLRAHPDLGGKLARAGTLTADSTREQSGLGLDQLTDQEFDRFDQLNTRYRDRFGFPFIICARLTTRDGVLSAFQSRLQHDREAEIAEALDQIHHIARLRLADLVTDTNS